MYKIILLLFFIIASGINTVAQEPMETGYVVYIDSAKNSNGIACSTAPKKTSIRSTIQVDSLKSRRGKFIVSYDDDYFMTDGVKHCLKLAVDNWEEKLEVGTPIRFHVCVSEELSHDVAIYTRVKYFKESRTSCLPDNLYTQNRQLNTVIEDTIKINAFIDWNSAWSFDDTYNGSVSLLSGIMRGISRILGFGCTLVKRKGGVGFSINMTPSRFDRLIYNGSKYLSDLYLSSNNGVFDSFFQNDTRLVSSSFNYDLYDTGHFVTDKSGMFFSLGYDNIMEYTVSDELKILAVNRETLDVLKEIGWNIVNCDKEIKCDNADALGYGSVYTGLRFNLRNISSSENMSAQWYYQTFNIASKEYDTVKTYYGTDFSVNPSIPEMCLDDFNCLQARIVASVGNIDYSFPLSLETRPLIKDARLSNYVSSNNGRYQIDLTLDFIGATGGSVLVSDDTGAVREYELWNGTRTITNLLKGYNLYVDISLENQYGTANMFIQDEPYLGTHVMSKRLTAVPTADGEITENIIRDSDIVVLVLPDQAGDGDSIVWRISLGGISKVIDVRPRDIRSYAFIMTSETLGCWMKRTYGEELVKCSGGDSWGGGNWEFDGTCSFICEVYSNGNLRGRSHSVNYLLEVLPDYPTVDVLKVWYDEDIQCPVASIKMNYPNADLAYLTVIQYLQQCWDYVEGVFDENSDRYYDVVFAEWGNTLYLTSSNRYGLSSGPQVRILPTDVKTVEKDKPYIAVSGNMVHVQMEGEHRVGVFSVDGRACASSVFTDSYSLALDKGLYIVRVSNCESNKIFVKSIIVK